jgi:hypothetical protein
MGFIVGGSFGGRLSFAGLRGFTVQKLRCGRALLCQGLWLKAVIIRPPFIALNRSLIAYFGGFMSRFAPLQPMSS